MSLVGTTVTLTINDETSTIDITGEIVEKYTGIVSSFRDEIINQIGVKKSVKTILNTSPKYHQTVGKTI